MYRALQRADTCSARGGRLLQVQSPELDHLDGFALSGGQRLERLQNTVGQDLSIFLRNVLMLVGGVAILFYMNWLLAAAMLTVVPALMIAANYWSRIIREISRQAQDELARASGALQEGLSAIETVQAFTREDFEVKRHGGALERTFGLFIRRTLARSWFASVISFLAFTSIAGVFWLGGSMVIEGTITASNLMSFLLYTLIVAGAVGALAELFGGLQSTFGATARIFEILDTPPDIADPPAPVATPALRGAIEFAGVSFTYRDRFETRTPLMRAPHPALMSIESLSMACGRLVDEIRADPLSKVMNRKQARSLPTPSLISGWAAIRSGVSHAIQPSF